MPMTNMDILEMIRGQQSGGTSLPSVSYNPEKPDETLAAISRRDQARYEQDYIPVEDKAIGSLRDMSIIDDAKERVGDNSTVGRSRQRASRDASRYGFRRIGAQVANADRRLRLDKATGDADTLNEARLNQFDRNRGFRNELINIGRGFSGMATQGMADAAQMQTTRENANRSAKAAADAQQTQMLGSLGAMALFAMI